MAKGINYYINNEDYSNICKSNGLERIKDFEKEKILIEYVNMILSVK